jgi:dihydrofolate reductase
MRRLKLFIASSIDGYIAGPDDDLSWLFHDGDYGYQAFFAGIDTVLIGRRTYEISRALPEWPFADRNVVVFTRRGDLAIATPNTVATARDPADVVADLRSRHGKDLWLAGGGLLVRAFLDAGLIDDFVVSIHPMLLGSGIPLVAPRARPTPLTLIDERRFPSGLMQLTYRADRD